LVVHQFATMTPTSSMACMPYMPYMHIQFTLYGPVLIIHYLGQVSGFSSSRKALLKMDMPATVRRSSKAVTGIHWHWGTCSLLPWPHGSCNLAQDRGGLLQGLNEPCLDVGHFLATSLASTSSKLTSGSLAALPIPNILPLALQLIPFFLGKGPLLATSLGLLCSLHSGCLLLGHPFPWPWSPPPHPLPPLLHPAAPMVCKLSWSASIWAIICLPLLAARGKICCTSHSKVFVASLNDGHSIAIILIFDMADARLAFCMPSSR